MLDKIQHVKYVIGYKPNRSIPTKKHDFYQKK